MKLATLTTITVLFVAAPTAHAGDLESNIVWTQSPINGHWYGLTAAKPWDLAQGEAQVYGGNLATIRDKAENDWIVATFGIGPVGRWIGFNDQEQEGNWIWVSGEPVTFVNWCVGEPNNGVFANEGQIFPLVPAPGSQTGCWNDEFASTLIPGLVELDSPDCDCDGIPDSYELAFGAIVTCSPLCADVSSMSLALGGTQAFELDAGPSLALRLYFVLGSASGTSPGTPVDGILLPLNVDEYLLATVFQANTPTFAMTLGVLDSGGKATASLNIPAGTHPSLAGLVLNHAFVVFDIPGSGVATFASNEVPLLLLP